jgi:pimeloyl-ACP methyl ester carboxylesterase
VDFGWGDSFPYDRARARDYHPAGRDDPAPGHQCHRDAHRAEPGPPLKQYREAHPDNRGDDNSVDHDPGEASEQVVFPTSTTVAHEQHWGERPEDPHWDERYNQKRHTDSGFAQDLTAAEKKLVSATQGQVSGPNELGSKVTTVAWRAKPTFYIVADQDRMIAPELEKKLAEQMRANTIRIASSHVTMLSHAVQVAEFISSAAGAQ